MLGKILEIKYLVNILNVNLKKKYFANVHKIYNIVRERYSAIHSQRSTHFRKPDSFECRGFLLER